MSMDAAVNAIRGFDAVVHLAAIPHPFSDPAERVMAVNMVTTYNVLEAVRLNGIPRIIYGCSESSTGFGIHNTELKPVYLPIDEAHPCWPHEVYSFTKRFGEVMVNNYTRAYGIESISLRYCWVWLERDAEAIRSIIQAGLRGERDPKSWFGCYVAPHDVAQAIRRSVSYGFPDGGSLPFEAFYICAGTTFFSDPTLDVLESHFDLLPELKDPGYFESQPFAPPFDCRKAEKMLGFDPTQDWRDFDSWEKP
jgi:nucleoside-diphosphate-sugar epimerase